MRTQHNFCTHQVRYVGITMIVILFGLNLCAGSRENSFQEVLKAVLFGGWSIPPTAHGWLLSGSPIRVEQCVSLVFLFWGEVGNFHLSRVVPREHARSPNSESRRVKLLRDGCVCIARVNLGMRNIRRVHVTDI